MIRNMTASDRWFSRFAFLCLALYTLLVALPIINLLAVALSGQNAVTAGLVQLWPKQFQWSAFRYVLDSSQFYVSLQVSAYMTIAGSVAGVLFAVLAAYPLSKVKLPGRKAVLLAFVFTMMFSGGVVPQYILIHKLHLLNSVWSVIFPHITNVFNLLIVKSFFENMPEEIEESAKIDGASQLVILFRVFLPISKPVIATISLFYAVEFWNEYFLSRLYFSEQAFMPLQVYLRTVIFEAQDPSGTFSLNSGMLMNLAPQSIINATVLLSMLPMVMLYPMLQKYFAKGILIGSVKG
ncbi:MAG: carbohydrate ABC transporter permease [Paenibacillaceae bacterium]|nr:carbohydrate ABC transporter permease [Paenibacillaceae bacterium]